MIRPSRFDTCHVMQLFRIARGFKMEDSESSVVPETESETGRPGERQGQLYTKTKKGKAVGIPTTVFLPKEETFTAWKSSIRSAIAELECISLGDCGQNIFHYEKFENVVADGVNRR